MNKITNEILEKYEGAIACREDLVMLIEETIIKTLKTLLNEVEKESFFPYDINGDRYRDKSRKVIELSKLKELIGVDGE